MNGTLHLTNILGHRISVDTDDLLSTMREMGERGWTSGEIPAGGIILPYAMADTFDFRLIGARELTIDGERGVMHQGRFYKRREFAAKTTGKIKMPANIKYSRGAKSTDAANLKEGAEDETQYVTLISFRGNGLPLSQFEKPAPRAEQRRAEPAQTQSRRDLASDGILAGTAGEILDLASTLKLKDAMAKWYAKASKDRTDKLAELTEVEAQVVLGALRLRIDEQRGAVA